MDSTSLFFFNQFIDIYQKWMVAPWLLVDNVICQHSWYCAEMLEHTETPAVLLIQPPDASNKAHLAVGLGELTW